MRCSQQLSSCGFGQEGEQVTNMKRPCTYAQHFRRSPVPYVSRMGPSKKQTHLWIQSKNRSTEVFLSDSNRERVHRRPLVNEGSRVVTNLEIGHMVLQQSLSIADVLFRPDKHEGNHALIKTQRGGDEELSDF